MGFVPVPVAVFKHALWDGPSYARESKIGEAFDKRSSEHNFHSEQMPPYLTWRCCYLLVAVLTGAARVGLGYPPSDLEEQYREFLKQLPPSVPAERFDSLVSFLCILDLLLWVIGVVAYLPVVAGTFMSVPSRGLPRSVISRKLVWLGWLLSFVPLFLLLLVYPIRSQVDWNALVGDVCIESIRKTYRLPGSELEKALGFLIETGASVEEDLKVLNEGTDLFCAQQGSKWRETFYNESVKCIWYVEDLTRYGLCPHAEGETAMQCFMTPIRYGQQNAGKEFFPKVIQAFQKCSKNLEEDSPLKSVESKNLMGGVAAETAEMLYSLLLAQRDAVEQMSEIATQSVVQSEYVVGLLIGVVVGKHLLAATVSLLTGLTEASMRAKVILPGVQLSGWLLILVTVQALPLYVTLLAIFQQILGDYLLGASFMSIVGFLSVGILTGKNIISCKANPLEMFSVHWSEYLLRTSLAALILSFLTAWAATKEVGVVDVQNYIKTVATPQFMAFTLVDFLYRKIVVAVSGTDAVLHAFVEAEIWKEAIPLKEKEAHSVAVHELGLLWDSQQNSEVLGEHSKRISGTE